MSVPVSKRVEWLSFLRGLNILLVVMFHVQLIDMSTGQNHQFCSDISYPFNPLRMPLFIFCSGGLLYLSRISKNWSVKSLYIDKAKRIFIPFIFFSFIYYFLKLLVNKYVKTQVDFSLGNFLESFIIFEGHPTAPLWFLATLMTLMLMYPLFRFLCNKVFYVVSFFLFCVVFYYIDLTSLLPYNFFYILKINHYLIYFFFGIFFFRLKIYQFIDNWYYLFIFITLYIITYYYHIDLLCSILGILWMISMSMIVSRYIPNLLSSYREYIYQIYLLSLPFQAFVELILWKKIFYCESFFLVFYILSILIGLFVPVLISKAVEKTNIKYMKMCFGLK